MANGIIQRVKILVIDDVANICQKIADFLQDLNYDIFIANDCDSGIQAFLDEKPDLVICDLHQGDQPELLVLSEINAIAPGTPLIVISNSDATSHVVKLLRLGASDYLLRPIVDLEVLRHSINRNIDRVELINENRNYHEKLEKTNRELTRSLSILQDDMQTGKRVQFNLMPLSGEKINGITFSYQILTSLYLSGDFVDFFKINDSNVLFYIADVSGHGASSAFVTVLLKNITYTFLRNFENGVDEVILSPASLANQINQELLALGIAKHMTLFIGVIQKDKLIYCVAGQYPKPILQTTNSLCYLQGEDMPVGLVEHQYHEYCKQLPELFHLVLLSDGLLELLPIEALADKEHFLLDMVDQGYRTTSQIAEKVGLVVADKLPDDIAILTVSRN